VELFEQELLFRCTRAGLYIYTHACNFPQVSLVVTERERSWRAAGFEAGGVFLLLQQRSKHPREMVMTPKVSTSLLTP